ncbi:MAG: hypothetical protein WAO95_01495 [Burkholderiales bacterium]
MSKRILLAALAAGLAGSAHAQFGLRPPAANPAPEPAAEAKQKSAAAVETERVEAVQRIFECVAAGLPREWRRAWAEIVETAADGKERSFEGKFYYLPEAEGAEPAALVPCSAREVAERVYALNYFLAPDRRRWKVATLVFTSDGKFELKYDYTE